MSRCLRLQVDVEKNIFCPSQSPNATSSLFIDVRVDMVPNSIIFTARQCKSEATCRAAKLRLFFGSIQKIVGAKKFYSDFTNNLLHDQGTGDYIVPI